MPFIRPDVWVPVDVESLEATADQVVRSSCNTLVVAGPGAGKTELLAQRACYLLQTGTSPTPRRILAISFKRDAAKNLGDRVKKRCGSQALRFDSYTLDAFAKSLVDRFRLALPDDWRPSENYEVATESMRVVDMRDWLSTAGLPDGMEDVDVEGQPDGVIRRVFDSMSHGHVLPYSDVTIKAVLRHWGLCWWREKLQLPSGTPSLTFPMLNRLAAFLLRCNSKIAIALRATYSHVFLDEFQDTTVAQYDLLSAAFLGSSAVLTAVGDNKQRIMLWAGAMSAVFDVYQENFAAVRHHLVRNYRSAPELVHIQQVIAQALEAETPLADAMKTDHTGSCSILEFHDQDVEAEYLADLIAQGIGTSGRKPRDYCVLVRQRTGVMTQALKQSLAQRNIKLRDETKLQDILAEPVIQFILAVLRLATRDRDAEAWEMLTAEIAALFGLDEADEGLKIEREAKRILQHIKTKLYVKSEITMLSHNIVELVGEAAVRSVYRQYAQGTYLKAVIGSFSETLTSSVKETGTLRAAVDD